MDKKLLIHYILGLIRVLQSSDDLRDYRGAGVRRTMATAIKYISANSSSLLPSYWQGNLIGRDG